jgi:GMP synthase-like glutamine amidotransferase
MIVGLVNMNPSSDQKKFIETLHSLHCSVLFLDATKMPKEDIQESIQRSPVQKWIFTGSPNNVTDENTYVVPLALLDLAGKQFFFICYSMESVLYQLGYPVVKRDVYKKEYFILEHPIQSMKNPAGVYRNHHYFIPASAIEVLSEYDGEAMIFVYKNSIMTQFHPERTDDGLQMLSSWIKEGN